MLPKKGGKETSTFTPQFKTLKAIWDKGQATENAACSGKLKNHTSCF